MNNFEKIRVRYAPSPTGHLHIGNARTAIFNWLFARHYNGEFIIRIEDTDTARNVDNGEESQLDNLQWLGVDWDEGPDKPKAVGPYRQSQRNEQGIYQQYIDQLLEQGLAYKSYKTPEQLEAERESQRQNHRAPHYVYEYEGMNQEEINKKNMEFEQQGLTPVVRFRVPEENTYKWNDIVKGEMSIDGKEIGGDWVIQKADGMPTYNFAVVVDDHLMQISHVLRGDDHISNTPKQLMIYQAFNWQAPTFGHMTLIINADTGKKLSKRDETIMQFIEQYRELGYLPDAMMNFIGLLGWSPVGEDEIFTPQQFIEMFDEKRLSKAPAKYDLKKLQWVNNQWMRNDKQKITPLLVDELIQANIPGVSNEDYQNRSEWYARMFEIAGVDGISFTREIVEIARYPFFELKELDEEQKKLLEDPVSIQLLNDFKKQFVELEEVSADAVMQIIRSLQTDEIKGRSLWNPLRVGITHEIQGPNLPEIVALMGREWTISNIEKSISL